MKTNKSLLSVLCGILSMCTPTYGYTYTVNVNSSVPISTQVMPALGTANGTLSTIQATLINIGTAINSQGDRQATLISQAFQKQQEFEIAQKKQDRQKAVIDKYKVPEDICATSISGGMRDAKNASSAGSSGRSLAGSSQNQAVKNALLSPQKATDIDSGSTAMNHKDYCNPRDAKLYEGTAFCAADSSMPDGDISLNSVLAGAGKPDKAPDLTFSEEQTDAALLYARNTTGRSAGRAPSKGEVKSAAGKVYLGKLKEYQAYLDAAQQPQMELIAASKPNPATKAAIDDALKVPSMKSYYERTVSTQGKNKGLSLREFEKFEVGRRYDNIAYQADLAVKNETELLKELIQVNSLTNYLLLENKNQLEKQNILSGQILALAAYEQYKKELEEKTNTLNQAVSANKVNN